MSRFNADPSVAAANTADQSAYVSFGPSLGNLALSIRRHPVISSLTGALAASATSAFAPSNTEVAPVAGYAQEASTGFDAMDNAKAGVVFSKEQVDSACAQLVTYKQSQVVPQAEEFFKADQNCTVADFKSQPTNKDLEFGGPHDGTGLRSAKSLTAYANLKRVSLELLGSSKAKKRNKVEYTISGREPRADVTVATFKYPEDDEYTSARAIVQHSYSGTLFDPSKKVSVDVERKAQRGRRLSQISRVVEYKPQVQNSELSVEHSVDPADPSNNFTLEGTLRFRTVKQDLVKNGQLYVNVSNYSGQSDRVQGFAYRVTSRNKYNVFQRPVRENIITTTHNEPRSSR
jgi:hypothetical protein